MPNNAETTVDSPLDVPGQYTNGMDLFYASYRERAEEIPGDLLDALVEEQRRLREIVIKKRARKAKA